MPPFCITPGSPGNLTPNHKEDFIMDYSKLQNGSDIRGVALEGIEGQVDGIDVIKVADVPSLCRSLFKGN